MDTVKRFIKQRCLGYSYHGLVTKIYYEHRVEMQSGAIKTMYSVDTEQDDIVSEGELVDDMPFGMQVDSNGNAIKVSMALTVKRKILTRNGVEEKTLTPPIAIKPHHNDAAFSIPHQTP